MRKIDFFFKVSREDKKVSFGGGVGDGHSRRLSERRNNLMHVCFYRNFRMAWALLISE